MASSDTLSLFVPNPGESVTETTSSGAKVFTTNTGDSLNSRIFPNQDGKIFDVGIQQPMDGDSSTTFGGRSKETSFIGNDDDNTVIYTGGAKDPTVKTGDGDDLFISKGVVKGDISLGEGDNTSVTGGMRRTDMTSGTGADENIFLGKVKSLRLSTGSGDDSLVFGGKVHGSTFLLGDGADVVDFSGKVQKTWIDLGGDDSATDQVFFNSQDDIGPGTQILNASEDDQLIIGGEEYFFDSSQDSFISDAGDSITFG